MFYYLVRKYWKGTLLAVAFYLMGYYTYYNFDDAMSFMVCMGSLAWMTVLIVHGTRGNGKKLVSLATGLVNLLVILWYVVSLKPLRRRADALSNPALEQVRRLERGETIEAVATDYGALEGGNDA